MEKIKTIEELKTCPFCGGEAEMVYSNDNKHQPYIQCKFGRNIEPKCPGTYTYQWNYRTESEAIKAWNTRK